jgi:hypothetical protein
MRIELDRPGEPHWLSKPRRVLRLIQGGVRQLKFRFMREREYRRFLREHGPVIKVEPMPPPRKRRK